MNSRDPSETLLDELSTNFLLLETRMFPQTKQWESYKKPYEINVKTVEQESDRTDPRTNRPFIDLVTISTTTTALEQINKHLQNMDYSLTVPLGDSGEMIPMRIAKNEVIDTLRDLIMFGAVPDGDAEKYPYLFKEANKIIEAERRRLYPTLFAVSPKSSAAPVKVSTPPAPTVSSGPPGGLPF